MHTELGEYLTESTDYISEYNQNWANQNKSLGIKKSVISTQKLMWKLKVMF